MNKEKISSQEIIDLVASKASVSKRAAEEFLKIMIVSVEEGLLAGEVVKIKNFGTFKLQWNEPRKSVNVQTGDEILITGYYKVVFVPDAVLKEQVNEPFAHLEPVELDIQTKKNELIIEEEAVSDPLRLFNEQASEIKNLISEIQALSSKSTNADPEKKIDKEIIAEKEQTIVTDVTDQEIEETSTDDELQVIIDHEVELNEENQDYPPVTIDNEKDNYQVQLEIPEEDLNSDLPTTPYLDNIKSSNKRKVWVWSLLILLLLSISGTGAYLYYSSQSDFSDKNSATKISEKISITEILNTISGWFTPAAKPVTKSKTIVIPKDTTAFDSISQIQPVDSIQILFDNPRVYTDFIASERIKEGSRLTIMSKRYYGNKDFWVYIYEANKDKIMNPDNIAIGTLIRIPKLDPRLIDVSNPRCIEKAKELHDIYIN